VGPEAGETTRVLHVLPDTKRVYCNVLMSALASEDRVTYTWTHEGRRYHQRTLMKRLGQRCTWTWNYIHIAGHPAQLMHGNWSVAVSVNGCVVSEASFVLLGDIVQVQRGVLPIILTCHSGNRLLSGHTERSDWGKEDSGSEGGHASHALAQALSSHLAALFGEKPSLIVNTLHRKFLDVDAEEEHACADARLRPYFREFHSAALSIAQRTVRVQRRAPLLINIRCHQEPDPGLPIMVGTLNGHTLTGINSRLKSWLNGDVRWREKGIITRMAAKGWKVFPCREGTEDRQGFEGCETVRLLGREAGGWCVDALELCVPEKMCEGLGFRILSKDVAECLALFYSQFAMASSVDPPS